MAIRVAIVGPGRVGQALGRRWAEAGLDLLGFVGRSAQQSIAACTFCGRGRALAAADLPLAHAVVFAVGDDELDRAVAEAAPYATRRCSLWLHTSGAHGLEVLDPLRGSPVRRGALHPAVPVPDAATGYAQLPGRPAVLLGDAAAQRLLRVLALRLPMRPLAARPGDRVLYHAACVLAANSVTALFFVAEQVLLASRCLEPADARLLVQELAAAAVQGAAAQGPVAALSGPVLRGDAATVARHCHSLQALPDAAEVYRVLQQLALHLAEERGLGSAAAVAVRRALECGGEPPA